MQLFSHEALKPGNTARIKGAKTERLALILYCSPVSGGYRIGLQFFGDDRSPRR
jgi:hypothetical protein